MENRSHWSEGIQNVFLSKERAFFCFELTPLPQLTAYSPVAEQMLQRASAQQDDYQRFLSLFPEAQRSQVQTFLTLPSPTPPSLLVLEKEGKGGYWLLLSMKKKSHLDLALYELPNALFSPALSDKTLYYASLGELAAAMAHELNNPLTSALGFAQLLTQKEIPPELRDDLTPLIQELQRACNLARNLLRFSEHTALAQESISLKQVLQRTLELAEPERQRGGVTVAWQFPKDPILVWGDAYALQQAFFHLIRNAFQAMTGPSPSPEGKERKATLTLLGSIQGNWTMVEVQDTGGGIPPAIQGKIFYPFFTTRAESEGTGLGLPMAARIIALHGGRLVLKKSSEEGTSFLIELPLFQAARSPADPSAAPLPARQREKEKSQPSPKKNGLSAKKPHILLADDDVASSSALRQLLLERGYQIEIAHGAGEAILKLKASLFDWVVSDWHMPGGGGRVLLDFCKEHFPKLLPHFLVITGTLPSSEFLPLQNEVAVLKRPFAIARLLEILENK